MTVTPNAAQEPISAYKCGADTVSNIAGSGPRDIEPISAVSAEPTIITPSSHPLLGYVSTTSLSYDGDFLDWALVSINDCKNRTLTNSVALPIETGNLRYVPVIIDNVSQVSRPVLNKIWAITASHGPVNGELSPVPYYWKMAGHRTFQALWVACLETDACKSWTERCSFIPPIQQYQADSYVPSAVGSSGTWIIRFNLTGPPLQTMPQGPMSASLVGQLISRRWGTRLVFFVPAYRICGDIESRLTKTVKLPSLKIKERERAIESTPSRPKQSSNFSAVQTLLWKCHVCFEIMLVALYERCFNCHHPRCLACEIFNKWY